MLKGVIYNGGSQTVWSSYLMNISEHHILSNRIYSRIEFSDLKANLNKQDKAFLFSYSNNANLC